MSKTISSRQLKAALAMVGWNVADLAEASGVSEPTIGGLETEDDPLCGKPETAQKLIEALEGAGVVFVDEVDGGPAVYLPKGKRRREFSFDKRPPLSTGEPAPRPVAGHRAVMSEPGADSISPLGKVAPT